MTKGTGPGIRTQKAARKRLEFIMGELHKLNATTRHALMKELDDAVAPSVAAIMSQGQISERQQGLAFLVCLLDIAETKVFEELGE